MDSLAVPLRVERTGRFARSDRIDAVQQVLASMLVTRRESWPDAPWYGLADLVESLNLAVADQGIVGEAMNTALDHLGIDWVRVQGVVLQRGVTGSGTLHLDIALGLTDSDAVLHRQLAV